MPYARRRPHLHNRRQTLQLSMESIPIDLWFPPADEPIVIDDFPAAVSMVEWLSDGPVSDAALVLLDERRQITAIILDPVPGVCFFPGMIDGPGFEVEFGNTLLVMFPTAMDEVDDIELRHCYETMRKHHALQGLFLLDIVVVHDDDVRSSSIAYDRDSVWFETFQPLQPFQASEQAVTEQAVTEQVDDNATAPAPETVPKPASGTRRRRSGDSDRHRRAA